jgi:hypothetical protein
MIDKLGEWSKAERTAGEKVSSAWQEFFQGGRKDVIERAEEINETARITEVQDKHQAELMALDNVVGVAVSLKMTDGKPTKKWALTVLVEKKEPKTKLPKASLVPVQLEAIPTDVVEVGRIVPLLFATKISPALPGYSIGHHNITAGTFGCLVRDIRRCCNKPEKDCCCNATKEECPGDYLILSNNHVLAASNSGKPGDLILQPGSFDGGVFPADGIATLERFEPITFGPSRDFPGRYNLVDAAVARPTFSRNVTASIIGLVIPQGIGQSFVGTRVIKVGRTTQVTTGRVLAVNATVVVGPYDNDGTQFGEFRHQILTTGMAAGGDSGSLLMDASLNAVGLLFAGSPIITIHNHISDVETSLGVRPVTAPRFG